ncbi:RUS1 family protein C16orf58 [Orchesella cincta]|uniref:RUS1 family protein C16orf58 n=1 Tax=Orchesella cincta TaxID=48709 RepID=A0A1D2NM68_ORCCI|nr:RUS1 family protein C16orf58 [Orchesella cincta]
MAKSILYSETRGAFSNIRHYAVNTDDPKKLVIAECDPDEGQPSTKAGFDRSCHNRRNLQNVKLALRQIFLPHGYPESVSRDYVPYQIWDTVQAFASSITGALATEAVMKGVGVGNEAATPLAAALTWILKNGSGHIGQIAFTWAKGTSLDFDCKKWRLFADALNDLASFIDLLAPLFPTDMIMVVLCTSSVARALVGVAGSATRAAVTQHQARTNNMADVSAKDGSQETLVNLVALVTSLILLPIVSGNTLAVWTLFLLFTILHLFGNYNAVKSLQLETLNKSRLLLCLQDYLNVGNISTVKQINTKESVYLGLGIESQDVCGFKIKMGVPLKQPLGHEQLRPMYIEQLISTFKSKAFIILPVLENETIYVTLHENIKPIEIIEAYVRSVFSGMVISQIRTKDKSDSPVRLSLSSIAGGIGDACSVNPMDRMITKEWENFYRLATMRGFVFDRHLLETDDWRAKWLHY